MKNIAKTAALAWRYLWSRPLAAALNLLLLTLGLAAITLVLLVSTQLDRAFERDLEGIDLVVGAKGSPLQLILAEALRSCTSPEPVETPTWVVVPWMRTVPDADCTVTGPS